MWSASSDNAVVLFTGNTSATLDSLVADVLVFVVLLANTDDANSIAASHASFSNSDGAASMYLVPPEVMSRNA